MDHYKELYEGLKDLNPAWTLEALRECSHVPERDTTEDNPTQILGNLFQLGHPDTISNRSRVLHLGCTTGFFLPDLARFTNGEVHGVELALSLLEKAETRVKNIPNVTLFLGDATELGYVVEYPKGKASRIKAESYDLVFSLSLIHHFKDPLRGIREQLRVCKKGGYVYVHAQNEKIRFLNESGKEKALRVMDVFEEYGASIRGKKAQGIVKFVAEKTDKDRWQDLLNCKFLEKI